RRVLQDGNAFDLVRVDLCEVPLNAVHLYQGSRAIQRGNTPDIYLRGIGPRLSRILHGAHTGELSGQRVPNRPRGSLDKVTPANGRDSTGNGNLLLRPVSYHHYLV